MQEYLIAFAVGGTICALSQLLMDKTKLMPGRIMVILVVTGVVLGAFGIYEPFKEWAGAGASVPAWCWAPLASMNLLPDLPEPGQRCRCWALAIRSGKVSKKQSMRKDCLASLRAD